jgi:hypothetical protein
LEEPGYKLDKNNMFAVGQTWDREVVGETLVSFQAVGEGPRDGGNTTVVDENDYLYAVRENQRVEKWGVGCSD